ACKSLQCKNGNLAAKRRRLYLPSVMRVHDLVSGTIKQKLEDNGRFGAIKGQNHMEKKK
ncbi:unnamed protein product, partial [Ceratitis capitata]